MSTESSDLAIKEFDQKTSALEQQLFNVIEGQDTDVIHEAMLLVMHRVMGSHNFGRFLLGCKYQQPICNKH